MLFNTTEKVCNIIFACAVLHNVALTNGVLMQRQDPMPKEPWCGEPSMEALQRRQDLCCFLCFFLVHLGEVVNRDPAEDRTVSHLHLAASLSSLYTCSSASNCCFIWEGNETEFQQCDQLFGSSLTAVFFFQDSTLLHFLEADLFFFLFGTTRKPARWQQGLVFTPSRLFCFFLLLECFLLLLFFHPEGLFFVGILVLLALLHLGSVHHTATDW